ncbi:L,D-transpeptidase family protein [Streptomyces sp. NPDC007205]|uniref:L,D-transpeptidase family protein n=1 Tax=Streptomyces sp. NPDC007205 TaxID=3154316 RepID=UPI0033F17F78
MRISRRPAAVLTSAATLTAFTALCGCTVQPPDTDGKPRAPVHVQPPEQTTAHTFGQTPGQTPGQPPVSGPANPTRTAQQSPAVPAAPPPRVLWSRGDSGPGVRELQARLRQAEWLFDGPTGSYDDLTEQAVRGFQGKRGLPQTGRTDSVTWERLVRMTRAPGTWELYRMGGQPAGAPDPRCMTGRVLCIDKTTRTLRWLVDGRTLSTTAVRFGSQYTPTREGVFHVYWKARHWVSTLYHSPMPYAMFFSGGQAVHYSYDFAARGYAGGSHGCVNVRDETAIAQLFAQVRVGDKVVVHW